MFGAIRLAKMESPERELVEIVKIVLSVFNIDMTVEAAIRDYNRTLTAYLDNGEI